MRKIHRPFTLVEVVLALGLLTLICLLSVGILQSVQRLWEGIQANSNNLEALQNIDRIADYTFKNMVPFHWQDEERKDRQVFRGDPSSMLYSHLHRSIGQDTGGIRFVELKLEGKQLVARYRQTPLLYWLGEPIDDSAVTKEIIAEGIDSLSFEYADREGEEIVWYEDWNEDEKKQIPLAVLMKIKFADGTEEQWLRRSAGNSWDTSYGRRQY